MKKLCYYAYTHTLRGDDLVTYRTPIVAEDRKSAERYALDPRNKIASEPSDLISVEPALDLADHTITELERIMRIDALSHCISSDALDVLYILATENLLTIEDAYRSSVAGTRENESKKSE